MTDPVPSQSQPANPPATDKLAGRVAFVTGGTRGIGAAIARSLANQGATAAVGYSRNPQSANKFVDELMSITRPRGASASAHQGNVGSADDCRRTVAEVIDTHGRLDILVNNAGIGHVGTMLTTAGGDLDRLYAVNVRGVFNVTKVFLPGMVARRRGSIVNLASIGGVVGIRDRLAYCMSKFAVVGLTKAAALDHATDGVRVNCICPGRVETPFVQARLKEYPDPAKAYREMSATQPVGRMARPEEIASAALYLAADESVMVTGSALMIDGGWSAG